ncbi:hypothetical protein DIPPA_26473 [Diplonema papillatum]|nr:hypothetical protein DIPPA_26473 [Diplonema papillatum]
MNVLAAQHAAQQVEAFERFSREHVTVDYCLLRKPLPGLPERRTWLLPVLHAPRNVTPLTACQGTLFHSSRCTQLELDFQAHMETGGEGQNKNMCGT